MSEKPYMHKYGLKNKLNEHESSAFTFLTHFALIKFYVLPRNKAEKLLLEFIYKNKFKTFI